MKLLRNLTLLGLGLGVCTATASAQELRTASEKVVACQDVDDALERLDCFEKAAAELSVALAVPTPAPEIVAQAPTAPADPVQPVIAEVAPGTAAPAEVPAAPVAVADAPATPEAPVQQAAASTTTEENIPRSSLPSWIPRISFGSDREVEKEPDEYETTITRIQVNRLGRHFFTTAEGHVWKQKKIEEIRAPKSLPADAILYQNITGGILIKIRETNRSYRVDRVE